MTKTVCAVFYKRFSGWTKKKASDWLLARMNATITKERKNEILFCFDQRYLHTYEESPKITKHYDTRLGVTWYVDMNRDDKRWSDCNLLLCSSIDIKRSKCFNCCYGLKTMKILKIGTLATID